MMKDFFNVISFESSASTGILFALIIIYTRLFRKPLELNINNVLIVSNLALFIFIIVNLFSCDMMRFTVKSLFS